MSVRAALSVSLPPVPVIAIWNAPVAADDDAEMVSWDVALPPIGGVIGFDAKYMLTPEGSDATKFTG